MAAPRWLPEQEEGVSCESGNVARSSGAGYWLNVESEEHDVAIPDDVLLSLGSHDAALLRALPSPGRDEVVIAGRLGADEPALEVGVNDTGRARRGVAAMDGPGPHLLLAGGEIRLEPEQVISRVDHAVESRFLQP